MAYRIKKMKIVIVNYGSGNLRSVQRGLARAGFDAMIRDDPQSVADASHIIVPGVGAFRDCMEALDTRGLLQPISDAIRAGKPYLGICLGYQILFSVGEEFGSHPGLNLIPGRVVRFPEGNLKVPHMGWNQVWIRQPFPIWDGVPDGAYFYFVHSYYPQPSDTAPVAAVTEYGLSFASAIVCDNLVACQFHPEKSQTVGLCLLANFARMK